MQRRVRGAAAEARVRLEASQQEEEASRSDSEQIDDDSASESSSHEELPAPLSAYEEQRAENMRANQQVLADMGLATPRQRPAARAPAASRTAPAAASKPAGQSRSSARKRQREASPSRSEAPAAAEPGPSLEPSADDVDAYFQLLLGEAGTGLVSAEHLRRAARELQLDTKSLTPGTGFGPANLEKMIDAYDQSGKGAISLGDFRHIMRLLFRGKDGVP